MTKPETIKNQIEEEEPPGITATRNELMVEEEEPPGKVAATDGTAIINENSFLAQVTRENWNDWPAPICFAWTETLKRIKPSEKPELIGRSVSFRP